MSYQRLLWHSGLTYRAYCATCNLYTVYTDYNLGFRAWFPDGFVYCPRCRKPLRHNENNAINPDGTPYFPFPIRTPPPPGYVAYPIESLAIYPNYQQPYQQPGQVAYQQPGQVAYQQPVQQQYQQPGQVAYPQQYQQPVQQQYQQPVQQQYQQPVQQPVQQQVQQPAQQPVQEPVQQPAQEPVQQSEPKPEAQVESEQQAEKPEPVGAEADPAKKCCPKCGFEYDNDDLFFCVQCGAKLDK